MNDIDEFLYERKSEWQFAVGYFEVSGYLIPVA